MTSTCLFFPGLQFLCTATVWVWGLVGGVNWNSDDSDTVASQDLFSVASLAIFLGYYAVHFYLSAVEERRTVRLVTAAAAAATAVLTSLALTAYNTRTSDFSLAPAQSRRLNRPCAVAGVYDWHDVWHILSALSLFGWSATLLVAQDGAIISR